MCKSRLLNGPNIMIKDQSPHIPILLKIIGVYEKRCLEMYDTLMIFYVNIQMK